jgi:hypothetical protein
MESLVHAVNGHVAFHSLPRRFSLREKADFNKVLLHEKIEESENLNDFRFASLPIPDC